MTLRLETIHPALQLVNYFWAAEKVQRAIIGIAGKQHDSNAARCAFHTFYKPSLEHTLDARDTLNLSITKEELTWLFAKENSSDEASLPVTPSTATSSARRWRNKLTHDLGPSHILLLTKEGEFLTPLLKKFLGCTPEVLRFLEVNYKNEP